MCNAEMVLGEKLRCLVVVPQLMVRYELPVNLGYRSEVHEDDGIVLRPLMTTI